MSDDRQVQWLAGEVARLEEHVTRIAAEPSIVEVLNDLSARVDKIAAAQLTAEDIASLRVIIEQDRRTRWLWSTARAWALWISAVVAGATIGLDALKTAVKRLIA